MALPDFSIDSFILSQYKNSDNLKTFIDILSRPVLDSSSVLNTLMSRLDIDENVGEQLDGIGDIVGIARPKLGDSLYIAPNNPPSEMPDEAYRSLLKAKIYANKSEGTMKDLLEYSNAVLNEYPVIVEDFPNLCLIVQLRQTYSQQLLQIFESFFPKAAGICLDSIEEGGDFGFDTDVNSPYSSVSTKVGEGYVKIVNP